MKVRKVLSAVFWVAVVAAPLLACATATSLVPDVTEIPLRWSASGEVSQWGPPIKLKTIFWFIGMAMSAANFAMAMCFRFNDRLFEEGLINGAISRSGALKVYVAAAVVIAAYSAGFYVFTMADALLVFAAEGLRP